MKQIPELKLSFEDTEWPFTYTDHDRLVARAIVFDDEGYLYFVHADREDDFGRSVLIETSGGGVEPGETPEEAIIRELREELGADTEIVCRLGVISDYYNLVHRHNINHYYLCRVLSFGEKHMTQDEVQSFHLKTLRLTPEEAEKEYRRCTDSGLGRLIARRELPVLKQAMEVLKGTGKTARKPRIAVASFILDDPEKGRPSPAYLNAVYQAGGLGFLTGQILTVEDAEAVYDAFDGLLLTGGADITEAYLSEPAHEMAVFASVDRDRTEMLLAKRFLAGTKPVLAICRGEQLLNVALGGTHDQHIFDRPEVQIAHQNSETRHPVRVLPGTLLASLFPGQETLTVNSTHHQAVKTLAPGAVLNAVSPDGVIEAYSYEDRILATQWHPERLLSEGMLPVFHWFIRKCK